MNWWIKIKQHDDTPAFCESILFKSGVRLLLGWEDFLVQFLQNEDFFLNEWCWSFTYQLSHDFHPQQCIIAVLLLIAYIPISILKLPRAASLQHLFLFVCLLGLSVNLTLTMKKLPPTTTDPCKNCLTDTWTVSPVWKSRFRWAVISTPRTSMSGAASASWTILVVAEGSRGPPSVSVSMQSLMMSIL